MHKTIRALLCAATSPLVLSVPAVALAQQAVLSSSEAAAAFGAREKILDASISPAGDQVAVVISGKGQSTLLAVTNLSSGESKVISSADGDPLSLTSCGWASNDRLICNHYGIADFEGVMLNYTRLAALDSSGGNIVPLGARERIQEYVQRSDGYVIDWLDGTSGKVLMARTYVPGKSTLNNIGGMFQGLGVDLMDTRTGKAEHVETADPLTRFYISDGRGNVRIKATDESLRFNYQTKGETTFRYRLANDKDWKPFGTYNKDGEGLYPLAVDGPANVAYSSKKLDGRDAIYRTKLDGSMATELIFAHPEVDVDGIVRAGRQAKVIGVGYTADRRQTVYFDEGYKKLGQALAAELPHLPLIRFVDASADGKKHIIHASSDTNPGTYYLYDRTTQALSKLTPARPELQDVPIAPVKAVRYRAADGTMVPAYLTLPVGSAGKNIPAIVMPHGGPAARDEWGFDWLAQFYANRGFAVLQPNFRGSAGYGEGWFQENGFKSWKTAIGDVNDAGRWLVGEGIADPSKLAIVGWSYGGYAALQSNVVDPELFKAVIAIAPVTDLGMLRSEQKGFVTMRVAQEYIGEGPHIEEGSPARHAARFKAPVLMFHGDRDINVSVKEAREMDSQLRKAGKQSELVVFKKIDHQLGDSAVRAQMLSQSDAFLRSALKL